jgi:hypothetical protein
MGTRETAFTFGKRSACGAATSVTSPTTTPFGYAPPIPDVSRTSPSTGIVSLETKSRVICPSSDPLTTPSARVRWTITATPERESVISRTLALAAVTSMTCPTSPPAAITAAPVFTPSRDPRSTMNVRSHESAGRPITRAPTVV